MSNRIRIYMTGVGGQGTLTATTLLARVAVAQGVEVVAGEIHGMAQRGGVVESTILLGGKAPSSDSAKPTSCLVSNRWKRCAACAT